MKSATLVLLPLSGGPSEARLVPLSASFRQVVVLPSQATLVTDAGEVWVCDAETEWVPRVIALPFSVKIIACSEAVVLTASTQGQAFAWGRDEMQTGVLGLEDVYTCESPMPIPDLAKVPITMVAIGVTHAAAVDSNSHTESGKLYSWGTGHIGQLGGSLYTETRIRPRIVEGTRAFSVRKVLCGEESTAVCTSGGFVYVFGRFGAHGGGKTPGSGRQQNRPKAPSHFEDVYATDVCLGTDFLAMVTENGRVYCFDDCLELVELPTTGESKAHSLAATRGSLLGLSSKGHAESGGMLQQWTPTVTLHNQKRLLDSLVNEEAVPCSLYTWRGVLYLLDDPWDTSRGIYSSKSDFLCLQLPASAEDFSRPLGQLMGETSHPKLPEYTEQLLETSPFPSEVPSPQGTNIPSDSESDASLIDLSSSSLSIGKTFEKALRGRLVEQQNITFRKAMVQPLIRLFARTIAAIKESRGMFRQRKKVIAAQQGAGAIAAAISKVAVSLIIVVFEDLRTYSEKKRIAAEIQAEKSRNVEAVVGAIESARNAYRRSFQLYALSRMHLKVHLYGRLSALFPRMARTLESSSLRIQRLAVRHWRELIVRQGMRKWILKKVVRSLDRVAISFSLDRILACSRHTSRLLGRLDRLLRHISREKARKDLNHVFTIWKHTTYQWSIHRSSHLQSLQVSFRMVSNALRRVLRSQAYEPGFSEIERHVRTRSRIALLRHPLLFFSSICEKILTRTCSWAYNNLLRYQRQAPKANLQQQRKVLGRVAATALRQSFRAIVDFSSSVNKQAVVEFVFRLERMANTVQSRALAYAITCLDLHNHVFRRREKEDCLVELGESHEGSLGRYFAAIQSTNLSLVTARENHYYAPEDSTAYLDKEVESGEYTSRPLELTVNTGKDLTPKHAREARRVQIAAGASPGSGPKRPPWKAPSKSGMPKPVQKDGFMRRRQYDSVLKERLAKKWNRADSPVMKAMKGIIEIVRSPEERRKKCEKRERSYKQLNFIVGINTVEKIFRSYLYSVWNALAHRSPLRRSNARALTVTPSVALSQDDTPDIAEVELENLWKRRSMVLGCQRLVKLLSFCKRLKMHQALLEIKDFPVCA